MIKQALITSSQCHPGNNPQLRSIVNSTYGIIFLGTPHSGSEMAKMGRSLEKLISRATPSWLIDTNPVLINSLEMGSSVLQNITSSFTSIQNLFQLYYFWEELKTKVPGGRDTVSLISDQL